MENTNRTKNTLTQENQKLPVDISDLIDIIRHTKQLIDNRTLAHNIEVKGLADYATQVDIQVQKYLQETFAIKYPEIDFLGEEHYENKERKGYYWIVDPVDGTTNLIHDYKMSAVSVALACNLTVVMGVIYQPYTDEVFYAIQGQGAYCNGNRIHTSDVSTMDRSLISIGTSPYHKEYAAENFALFQSIFADCEDIRRCGSAAIDLTYVATGRTECYFEKGLKIWDYAAGMLLVTEAGGKLIDYHGKPLQLQYEANVVAGNGKIEDVLVEKYFMDRS